LALRPEHSSRQHDAGCIRLGHGGVHGHQAATCDRIRASALRLFREQGYDATTVEQIAAAAGVSHMTFFRYFPAKEDVALSDSYDPLIASHIAQTPATWPLIQRIRAVLAQGLRQVYDTDRDTLLAQNKTGLTAVGDLGAGLCGQGVPSA
jgi:AcrR family transcriptional regulator